MGYARREQKDLPFGDLDPLIHFPKVTKTAPSLSRDEDLTRQVRNFILTLPISQFSSIKNKFGKRQNGDADESDEASRVFAKLDTIHLTIALMDFIGSKKIFGLGALREEVIDHIIPFIREQDQGLTEEQASSAAMRMIDNLCNSANAYRAYEIGYWSAKEKANVRRQFRLMTFSEEIDGKRHYALTQEGWAIHLMHSAVDSDLYQEIEVLVLNRMLERGEFNDALSLARINLSRTGSFRQQIQDALRRCRYLPKSIDYARDLRPILEETREHIGQRLREEGTILSAIPEQLARANVEQRGLLIQIEQTLGLCQRSHLDLHGEVQEFIQKYLVHQAKLFRAPSLSSNNHDLLDDILTPFLALSIDEVCAAGQEVTRLLNPPDVPPLFDPMLLVRSSEDRVDLNPDEEFNPDLPEIEPFEQYFRTFTDELMEPVRQFFEQYVGTHSQARLSEAIATFREQGFSELEQQGLLYLFLDTLMKGELVGRFAIIKEGWVEDPLFKGHDFVLCFQQETADGVQ